MFIRGMIFPGGGEPVLQGEGVCLRYPRTGDFAAWSALRLESREFLMPWEATWAPDELTRVAFRRRLRRYRQEIRNDTSYPFLVIRSADNALIGGCALSNVRRGVTQTATLGYWIGSTFARQGHMTAAGKVILPFTFTVLGLHRVEAAVY